jgi:hypothetical protein
VRVGPCDTDQRAEKDGRQRGEGFEPDGHSLGQPRWRHDPVITREHEPLACRAVVLGSGSHATRTMTALPLR